MRPALEKLAQSTLSSTSSDKLQVAFRGLQTGEVEAVIKAAPADSQRLQYESGVSQQALSCCECVCSHRSS